MENEKDKDYILKIKQELDNKYWDFERREIIEKAVKELETRDYSKTQIRELFKLISLKEQDNSYMVSNNTRYLEILDEILNS